MHSVDFDEWRTMNVRAGLRPYEDDGEIARWRLEARLNEIGGSFLLINEFLESD